MLDECMEDPKAKEWTFNKVTIGISDLINDKRKRIPELKNFPKSAYITSYYDILVLSKHFKKKKDITFKIDDDDDDTYEIIPTSFKAFNDKFYIISEYYPFLQNTIALIFAKDLGDVTKELNNTEAIYKKGNYYLDKNMYGYYLTKIKVKPEEEPELNDDIAKQIEKDVESFFKKESFFRKNKIPFKRGLLFYGRPGNGKTSCIKNILEKHKDKFGIIIDCSKEFQKDAGDFLRRALKNEKKIIIFEDIDGLEHYYRSAVLNFLDGVEDIENTLFIATTNSTAKLDSALVSRPSRFDRVYNFDLPSKPVRRKLIKRFFPNLNNKDLDDYAIKTDGFSGAYFKELFIFKNLQECSISEAIENMKNTLGVYKSLSGETEYLG